MQLKPKEWAQKDWRFFLDVWGAIISGKQLEGVNRGEVDKQLASNWKRHFSNYEGKQGTPTPAELQKRKEDLDKDKKKLPTTMKEDIERRKVPRAEVIFIPPGCKDSEEESFLDVKYAQIKRGDPR